MTEAEQKTRAEEKRRREELLLFLLLLLSQLKQPMDAMTLPINARDRMLIAHREAAFLGNVLGAGIDPRSTFTERDDAIATRRFDNDLAHLRQFADDIMQGRYTKPTDPDEPDAAPVFDQAAMGRRMKLYADSVATTATMAFVLNSPAEDLFEWVLDHPEQSCPDCPELAAGGPYTSETLPALPRDGSGTACSVGCKCSIQRADGVKGFDPWT